jgi:hypothetical protein
MFGILLRLVLAVVFGLATFWPEYGLLWIALRNFNDYPLIVVIAICVWSVAFSLLLPLSRFNFQLVSSLAILVACGAVFWRMDQLGRIDLSDRNFWLTWGGGLVFFVIGWLMISTRIWRATHGIMATDDTDEN